MSEADSEPPDLSSKLLFVPSGLLHRSPRLLDCLLERLRAPLHVATKMSAAPAAAQGTAPA